MESKIDLSLVGAQTSTKIEYKDFYEEDRCDCDEMCPKCGKKKKWAPPYKFWC